MHPEQIKAAIRMKGTTPARLADEMDRSPSLISAVINGRGNSAEVKKRISQVTGLPVSVMWPTTRVCINRRSQGA